ncbi:MAG: hypothetical protein V4513_02815 [Pseudomonadota bacterium]
MTGARGRALMLGLVAAFAAALIALAFSFSSKPQADASRPTLLLLTSLPLMFGEDLSLEGGGSPALTALQKRFRVVPISVASPAELKKGRLLLMAQPLAQTAENLVALDDWVRKGGRLLLLADPMLEWPSKRPLGDPLRPPAMFMDTGLLGHWGLRLDSPEERGPKGGTVGGAQVMTASPGVLAGKGCAVSNDGLVAYCRIGKGSATVIADADLLDVENLDGPTENNLSAVLAELAALSR